MKKYRIRCLACNTVHGYSETAAIKNLKSMCSSCGMERISIEPNPNVIRGEMEFDLFLTNKRTSANRHSGFVLSLEMVSTLSEEKLKDMLIEQAAKALAKLLKVEENCVALLEQQADSIGGNVK